MAKGQVTFEFNDEQIAEIQRRVCDGVEHILGSLQKENQELKDENKRLRETPSRIAEYTELKKEVQELKDDNEKLIKLGIDLSGWICTLANYSGDARNRLKDNVWFEGVKRKYISEVKYGGNK